ncbi:sulfite exporter TauE/SafE family protein [Pareuzebyella sediminis]|uniref:sulfite exporter TauE/SafE family protein n=1 Tax=Pareuzebyella sediminis TaxID=2607998 RepID=UPI0011F01483|nr:sulfite exporter TauE/SafE family protein [Pareuzebyella sediminis]
MEEIQILGYVGALAVGLILGLMGSGGSLMAVPIFTYLFHISPVTTTAYSLFVVGTSASISTLKNLKKGLINVRLALIFAIPAFIAVFCVRRFLIPVLPDELFRWGNLIVSRDTTIMVLFALLLLAASFAMIFKRMPKVGFEGRIKCNATFLFLEGALVGAITGIVGIGGGFLIIPALVFLLKLPMREAIATSLFIIALKSLIGFLGDVGNLQINWLFLLSFTFLSIFGILLGSYFSVFVKAEKLKKSFGWFVLTIALFVLYKELF